MLKKRCKPGICSRGSENAKMVDYLEKMMIRTLMFLTEEIQILKTFKPSGEMFTEITSGCEQLLLFYADFFAVERLTRNECMINPEKIVISKFLQSLAQISKYQSNVKYGIEKTPLNPTDEMVVDVFILFQVFQCLLSLTDKDNQTIKGGCFEITSEEVVFYVEHLLTAKTERKGKAFCMALNRNYTVSVPGIPFEIKCAMLFYYIRILNGRSLAYVNEVGECCFKFVLPRFEKAFSARYTPVEL